MRSTGLLLGSALLFGVAIGCGNAHEADRDGGFLGGDSWVFDTGGGGEWCGRVQCGVGTSCCNASCGICTPPGVGCVAIVCGDADAGPIARVCGGIAARPCDASEYCDYPDGSFCGGDDEQGICRPRPTDCPDPGGNLVCGCDGHTYVGDCSASMAGTDIARPGSCGMPTPAHDVASATRSCGPTDGPAWDFLVTSGTPVCGGLPTGAALTIQVQRDVPEGSTTTFMVSTTGDASATACPYGVGGPPCFPLTGTVTVTSFHANVSASLTYSLQASDGTTYANTNLTVTTWCAGAPLCG